MAWPKTPSEYTDPFGNVLQAAMEKVGKKFRVMYRLNGGMTVEVWSPQFNAEHPLTIEQGLKGEVYIYMNVNETTSYGKRSFDGGANWTEKSSDGGVTWVAA